MPFSQPDGDPPEGLDLSDPDFLIQTHCCDDAWWVEHYPDETIRNWVRWFKCGPLGYNVTCITEPEPKP